ncbi:MAG: 6-phosphogluconate dehydrogenase (decarboxylating) [Bacteroidetes bacterium QS_9_68_14]|nr:MAG: 6-phosphogluconate dehydrogenase (decarboxylating) [Bacteroidetes bacterium QS_9_68_14]
MHLGMIGLGKMGLNMARRLLRSGEHDVTGFDLNEDPVAELESEGGSGAASLEELTRGMEPPRVLWTMVPAGDAVDQTLDELVPLLSGGDIVVDGGNSNYQDTLRRAEHIHREYDDLHYADAGVSGGVWGLEEGYSLMVGGDEHVIARLRPALKTLAPGAEKGWGHVGPAGAGHFVKMVHNGIEYGLMEAYAEGFAIMEGKEEFDLDLTQVSRVWQHGSVVRSWLLDMIESALEESSELDDVAPYVDDSGEGRWTVKEAIDLDIPAPVITQALLARLESQAEDSYAYKLLAAMRNQFGGHAMKEAE